MNGHVTLKVYDILGREIDILVNENKEAGMHEIKFNPANLPSGVYIYKLESKYSREIKKMILVK
jgi:hypothetical protein